MVLHQNATRRRRIVIDPNNSGSETEAAFESQPGESRKRKRLLYKSGAERRYQWKTTDLLPKRAWGLSITIGLIVTGAILLNLLFLYSDRCSAYLGTSGVQSLQLSGHSTLAAWFSSFLLIISGFASLQIYALRQHRQDDYRGSYRLWLWMAGILMLASVNCIVDLTAMGTHLIHGLTQFSLSTSLVSLIAIKLLLLSGLVARGCHEVRESRTALVLVVLVWLAYGAAATLRLPQLQPVLVNVDEPTRQLILGNLTLAGTIVLFTAQIVFARFVYLQALGMIRPQAAQKKKTRSKVKAKTRTSKGKSAKPVDAETKSKSDSSKTSSDESKSEPRESAPARSTVTATSPAPKAAPLSKFASDKHKPSRQDSDSDADDELESGDETGILKLSKSEQRRLRKQQQSHRRAA